MISKRQVAPQGGVLRSYFLSEDQEIPIATHAHGHAVAVLSGKMRLHLPAEGRFLEIAQGEQVEIKPDEPHGWKAGAFGVVFWCYSWGLAEGKE